VSGNGLSGVKSSASKFLLIFLLLIFSVEVSPQATPVRAQSPPQPIPATPQPTPVIIQTDNPNPDSEPTPQPDRGAAGDSDTQQFQQRIERARALAAAHQLATAANELESVRKGASDVVVRSVTSVMLMGIYLEEGNYPRAESLLEETFSAYKPKDEASLRTFFALAGQAVIGARSHLARYRSFGINVNSDNLPVEAAADLDRLRSLLERMVAQARTMSEERKTSDSLALLEDVIGIRLSIFRDIEDRARWEAEYARAREGLASSQTQIALLGVPFGAIKPLAEVKTSTPDGADIAEKDPAPSAHANAAVKPVAESKDSGSVTKTNEDMAGKKNSKVDLKPRSTGSLNSRATKKVLPTYPPLAKSAGTAGVVRVYVTVDETGKVIEVSGSEGPVPLRANAEEAAWGWRFLPTAIGGKALRISGFIEFVFEL